MSLAREWVEGSMKVHGAAGDELLVDCPWCSRTKMYVNPDRAVFVCFKCRESGRLSRLIAKVEGVEIDRAEQLIKSRAPTDPDELLEQLRALGKHRSEEEEPIIQELPLEFIPCFNGKEWRVPEYLNDRGFDDEHIIKHAIGYAEDGRYRDRVIVPVHHAPHRTFLSRLMGPPSWFSWNDKTTGELITPPKYLTPRHAGLADMLYGMSWVKPGDHIIGVEGVFDAIRLIGLGFPAVAFFGKRISTKQAAVLRRLRPASLTLLFDADASTYAYLDALELVHSMPTFVSELPSGFDPDTLGLKRGRRGVERVVKARRAAGDKLDALSAALQNLG